MMRNMFSEGEQCYFQNIKNGTAIVSGNEKALEKHSEQNIPSYGNGNLSEEKLYEIAKHLPEGERPRTIHEHRRRLKNFPQYRGKLEWLERLVNGGHDRE